MALFVGVPITSASSIGLGAQGRVMAWRRTAEQSLSRALRRIRNAACREWSHCGNDGVTGHNVRYVLLIGTALAVIWVLFAAGYVVTTG